MLIQIHIKNFITIETFQLDVLSGTTVITGESGAGKSILMNAIELGLGERATNDIVRPGGEKADILLCFDIKKYPLVQTWLKHFDLETDTNECIIRRTIHQDGRSRCYINGTPSTLQLLRELSEHLITIHGQHEHQSLFKLDKQRTLLDHFAKNADLSDKVEMLAKEWQVLSHKKTLLQKSLHENQDKCELIQFQLRELSELQLTPNEFESLENEHKKLASADALLQNIAHSLDCLIENDEQNALKIIREARLALDTVQHVDPIIASKIESLNNAMIEIHDTGQELRRYIDKVDINPERLQCLEERLGVLFHAARKYKTTPQELFQLYEQLSAEYAALESSDEQLTVLNQKIIIIEKNYHAASVLLSESRHKAATILSHKITEIIHQLALPHSEFYIHLEPEACSQPSPFGMEKIIFQIKTNTGLTQQPLAKIASGGELSRISLSIHLATAEQQSLPTLLFDEIDSGVSGATAEMIGKLLRKLGNTHQVLCVTHSPQVAACGHQHLRVEKQIKNNITCTHIQSLSPREKVDEIARMLGGIEMTKKTLAHATEMLEKSS